MRIIIAAFLYFISGCATNDYWYRTHEPRLVLGVIDVDHPGGIPGAYFGFANFVTGLIEVKRGLSESLRECVIKHERKHFAGYSHDPRKGFVTDCGDGMLIGS